MALNMTEAELQSLLNLLKTATIPWNNWSSTGTYDKGAIVIYEDKLYSSKVSNNINHIPSSSTTYFWDEVTILDVISKKAATIAAEQVQEAIHNIQEQQAQINYVTDTIQVRTIDPATGGDPGWNAYQFVVLQQEPAQRQAGYIYVINPQTPGETWLPIKLTSVRCLVSRVSDPNTDADNTCNLPNSLHWKMKYTSLVKLKVVPFAETDDFLYTLPDSISCNVTYTWSAEQVDGETGQKYRILELRCDRFPPSRMVEIAITASSTSKQNRAYKKQMMIMERM